MAGIKQSITYDQFNQLDFRVGTVVAAEAPAWSKKLLKFTVDFGQEIGRRTIFSGIRQWYAPEELMHKQFCFLVNLEPKKMGEEYSQGMMVMADGPERPVVIPLTATVPDGTVVR